MASPGAVRLYEQEVEVIYPGLTSERTQRIPYGQIAQILLRKGLVFATLVIESTGGHTLRVEAMPKNTAAQAQAAIQERMNRPP